MKRNLVDIPLTLNGHADHSEEILVYEGECEIEQSGLQSKETCSISLRFVSYGNLVLNIASAKHHFQIDVPVTIRIPDAEPCTGYISTLIFNSTLSVKIVLTEPLNFGLKRNVDYLSAAVANWVTEPSSHKLKFRMGDWYVALEAADDLKSKKDVSRWERIPLFSHRLILEKRTKTGAADAFSFEEGIGALRVLQSFFQFYSGMQSKILLFSGHSESLGQISQSVESLGLNFYMATERNWRVFADSKSFDAVNGFFDYWQAGHGPWLEKLMAIYVESKRMYRFDHCLVLSQIGLEMLTSKIQERYGLEKPHRSNFVEQLAKSLDMCSIPKSSPGFASVKATSGPEAIVKMRNKIIHEDKIYDNNDLFQALRLSLEYFELLLLNLLGYEGLLFCPLVCQKLNLEGKMRIGWPAPWANRALG